MLYGGARSTAGESERKPERRGKGEHGIQDVSTHGKSVLGGSSAKQEVEGCMRTPTPSVASFWCEVEEDLPAPLWAGLGAPSWARGQWGGLLCLFSFFSFLFLFFFYLFFSKLSSRPFYKIPKSFMWA